MYSIAATSVLTALALVLVFLSSLAVCCLFARLSARRRYQPAKPDELNQIFLPKCEKRPIAALDSGHYPIGQLLTKLSIKRKHRQLPIVKNFLPKQKQLIADCRIDVNHSNRCHDNAGFCKESDLLNETQHPHLTNGVMSFTSQYSFFVPAGSGVNPAEEFQGAFHHSLHNLESYQRSRETEL